MINELRAKEFQILYEKETGEKISLEQAFSCSENLIELIKLIRRPINRIKLEELRKQRLGVII